LSVANNCIADFAALDPLGSLPLLAILNLDYGLVVPMLLFRAER